MDVSAKTWSTLSELLDEALDLEPAARAIWMEQLSVTQPALAPSVRKLLEAHASSETADVLARLPTLSDAASATRVSALSPGDRIGPYRLKRELGSGGMADVWLAERADGAFTREVALKLPLINRLRRDLAQRFARERDILARLEHPHIARFYDAGVSEDGLSYLAMEYVDGKPITAYCDEHRLTLRQRLYLFSQVLGAVQYAHANLVIHRDLKPSNILVTADGQVRLLDFGIAKLLADDDTAHETQLTQLSGRAFTPDYASPEQIKGEPLTIATDIYSLGVVLYELFAGAPPYKLKVNSPAQLEQAVLEIEPPRMSGAITAAAAQLRSATSSQLIRALRGDLDTIALKTLAKSPDERYTTAAAFADDLQRERDGRPVFAQPASLSYRTKKFLVRNRIAVGVASLFAVVLVAATVVSLWQAQLARAQAARADEVKRFVLSIFENADTGAGGSRKTTAVDLLQQTRVRLAAAGVTDTATYIELLTSIGVSLMSLGEYRDAEIVLEEAVQKAEPVLGGEHPNTLAAQLALGQILETNGKLDRAQAMLNAAEIGMRRSANVAGLANALQTQALLAIMQRDYDTAIARAAEAVELAESLPATEARTKMLANSALATSRISGLRPGRLPPAQRAYELAKQTYGDRVNANLLALRSLYATALVQEGDAELGLAELKELMREQIELLGPDHHDVARTLQRIAQNALLLGDPHAAIESFTQLRRFYPAAVDGRPTADIGTLHSNLGLAYMIARQDSRAETELRRSIAILAEAQGKDYAGTRLARSALAQTMVRQGRYADAESTLAELMAGPPPTQTDEAVNKSRLGMLRSAQKRHDEAIALLEQAVEFHVQTRSPANIASATLGLGSALLEAGRAEEALEKLETVVSVYERRHPRGSPGRADATMQLGRAQLAVGRASAAAETLQKSAAYFIGFDATNRHTAVCRLWLARAYAASGESRRASDELREARGILAKSSVPSDQVLLAETQRLVEPAATQR